MAVTLKDADRLKPFRRGDHLALALVLLGALLFLAGTAGSYLFGLVAWGELSAPLRGLNVLSLLLATFAFAWSVASDWWWLHQEESDIEFVLQEGRHAVELVLLEPAQRAEALRGRGAAAVADAVVDDARTRAVASPRVRTLIDDRVLRVSRVAAEGETGGTGAGVREAEMRALALSRSARVGGAARYVSGLLLLLTVLGTFVGVKSALPGLVGALDLASGGGDAVSAAAQMQSALRDVAAAFGSNLNALIGAIALGVAGFGLGAGRQSMLARLEQASSLYVYSRLGQGGSTSHFTAALRQLGQASGNLGGIATHLEGLGTSIEGLSQSVESSLETTTETLQSILRQQREEVKQESRQAADKVERQLTETLLLVREATDLYEVLAAELKERNEGFTEASEGLRGALRELGETRGAFTTYADSATRTLDARLKEVELSVRRQAAVARRTYRAHEQIRLSLGELLVQAGQVAGMLGRAEEERRRALQGIEVAVAETVADRFGVVHREFEASLSSIPDRVRAGVESALGAALAELAKDRARGDGAAPAPAPAPALADSRALDRLALVLDELQRQLREERRRPAPDTLERLDVTLQSLDRSLSRTFWQRLLPWRRSTERERGPRVAARVERGPALADSRYEPEPTPPRPAPRPLSAERPDEQVFAGMLAADGQVRLADARPSMVEIRWREGEVTAEVAVNPAFAFTGDTAGLLDSAFDVDGGGAGVYETLAPARIQWSAGAEAGRVVTRGRARQG